MTINEESIRLLSTLLEKNVKHASSHQAVYRSLAKGQNPRAVLVFCSDSRLQTCMFGESTELLGDVFIARDIGNSLVDSEAAVDFAVMFLNAGLLFILGHTGCSAVKTAAGDYSAHPAAVKSRLARLEVCGDEARDPQTNVDAQVGRTVQKYQQRIRDGRLIVVGGVFDLTGCYGGSEGSVYLTNLNGETDIMEIAEELQSSGAFPQSLQTCVKRL